MVALTIDQPPTNTNSISTALFSLMPFHNATFPCLFFTFYFDAFAFNALTLLSEMSERTKFLSLRPSLHSSQNRRLKGKDILGRVKT